MIFVALIVALLLLMTVMQHFLKPVNAAMKAVDPASKGRAVLALEFASTDKAASELVSQWGERGRVLAAFTIGLDALFIVIYVAILILGCHMGMEGFAGRGWTTAAALGYFLAWAAVTAGLLDFVENWGQIKVLSGELDLGWPRITSFCARIKFFLAGLAAAYVVTAMAILRARFFH